MTRLRKTRRVSKNSLLCIAAPHLLLLERVDDGALADVGVAHHPDADLLLVWVKLGELETKNRK